MHGAWKKVTFLASSQFVGGGVFSMMIEGTDQEMTIMGP